jgi:peptidoglycan/LPS O-acetylase OafA/YrhL
MGVLSVHRLDWFGAALFFRNYLAITPARWLTGHFWSLSVEEHFYLFVPGLLLLVKRRRLQMLIALSGMMALWGFFVHFKHPSNLDGLRTDTRICSLLIPAIFAVALRRDATQRALIRYTRSWITILSATLILITLEEYVGRRHLRFSGACLTLTSTLIDPIMLSMLLISTIFHPTNRLARLLELPGLRFVGALSYSLYLWQQIFFVVPFAAVQNRSIFSEQPWIVRVFATAALAYGSYRLVERPMIKIGQKTVRNIDLRSTPGTIEIA